MAEADFPTRWGHFRIMGFEGHFDPGSAADRRKEEAVALVLGDIHAAAPLVRIHSQCLTGDVFGSLRCDCRQQLEMGGERDGPACHQPVRRPGGTRRPAGARLRDQAVGHPDGDPRERPRAAARCDPARLAPHVRDLRGRTAARARPTRSPSRP